MMSLLIALICMLPPHDVPDGGIAALRDSADSVLFAATTRADSLQALKMMGHAASAGDVEAEYRLGLYFRRGIAARPNPKEEAYWMRKAASNGHPEAQLEIGRMFAEGRGVLPDRRIAAEWIWRAASAGVAAAQYEYAVILRDGIGIDPNPEQARLWFERAADQDYLDARTQAAMLPVGKSKIAAGSLKNQQARKSGQTHKRRR